MATLEFLLGACCCCCTRRVVLGVVVGLGAVGVLMGVVSTFGGGAGLTTPDVGVRRAAAEEHIIQGCLCMCFLIMWYYVVEL